jgi:hypothetical protein
MPDKSLSNLQKLLILGVLQHGSEEERNFLIGTILHSYQVHSYLKQALDREKLRPVDIKSEDQEHPFDHDILDSPFNKLNYQIFQSLSAPLRFREDAKYEDNLGGLRLRYQRLGIVGPDSEALIAIEFPPEFFHEGKVVFRYHAEFSPHHHHFLDPDASRAQVHTAVYDIISAIKQDFGDRGYSRVDLHLWLPFKKCLLRRALKDGKLPPDATLDGVLQEEAAAAEKMGLGNYLADALVKDFSSPAEKQDKSLVKIRSGLRRVIKQTLKGMPRVSDFSQEMIEDRKKSMFRLSEQMGKYPPADPSNIHVDPAYRALANRKNALQLEVDALSWLLTKIAEKPKINDVSIASIDDLMAFRKVHTRLQLEAAKDVKMSILMKSYKLIAHKENRYLRQSIEGRTKSKSLYYHIRSFKEALETIDWIFFQPHDKVPNYKKAHQLLAKHGNFDADKELVRLKSEGLEKYVSQLFGVKDIKEARQNMNTEYERSQFDALIENFDLMSVKESKSLPPTKFCRAYITPHLSFQNFAAEEKRDRVLQVFAEAPRSDEDTSNRRLHFFRADNLTEGEKKLIEKYSRKLCNSRFKSLRTKSVRVTNEDMAYYRYRIVKRITEKLYLENMIGKKAYRDRARRLAEEAKSSLLMSQDM